MNKYLINTVLILIGLIFIGVLLNPKEFKTPIVVLDNMDSLRKEEIKRDLKQDSIYNFKLDSILNIKTKIRTKHDTVYQTVMEAYDADSIVCDSAIGVARKEVTLLQDENKQALSNIDNLKTTLLRCDSLNTANDKIIINQKSLLDVCNHKSIWDKIDYGIGFGTGYNINSKTVDAQIGLYVIYSLKR